MNQKQSEDFDEYIKKLAADADSPFHEQSWHEMEYLLNKRKRKRFALLFWPLGLLIIGTTLLAIIKYLPSDSQKSMQHPLPVLSSEAYNSIKPNLYPLKVTTDRIFGQGPVTSDFAQIDNANLEVEQNKTGHADMASPIANAASFNHESKTLKQKISGTLSSTGVNKSRLSGLDKSPYADKFPLADKVISRHSSASLTESKDQSPSPNQSANVLKIDPNNETVDPTIGSSQTTQNKLLNIQVLPPINIESMEYDRVIHLKHWDDPMPITTKSPRHTSLSIGLGWSPEYTSVVQRSYSQLGKAYGVDLGFKMNRFTLSAGLQKSTKYYNAMKEDYEIPYNSYFKKLTINNIKGACSVLQLPIYLKYDLINTKSFVLVLNAGISSMRMDREVYAYDYLHANSKPGHSVDDYTLKNWHWLAAASAGVSIQKSISRHLGISITPYYQLPLKGVGEGHVRLRSFGSQFALSWTIPTSK
ncbi:MAG: hypothetical protein IPF70_14270 [Saprospiraceae bacterium]|nr:hypothetical protein [Saprospiraceae bacterium]MBK9678208.1 hypothetical protein [Saprospiraceae bacterium]